MLARVEKKQVLQEGTRLHCSKIDKRLGSAVSEVVGTAEQFVKAEAEGCSGAKLKPGGKLSSLERIFPFRRRLQH